MSQLMMLVVWQVLLRTPRARPPSWHCQPLRCHYRGCRTRARLPPRSHTVEYRRCQWSACRPACPRCPSSQRHHPASGPCPRPLASPCRRPSRSCEACKVPACRPSFSVGRASSPHSREWTRQVPSFCRRLLRLTRRAPLTLPHHALHVRRLVHQAGAQYLYPRLLAHHQESRLSSGHPKCYPSRHQVPQGGEEAHVGHPRQMVRLHRRAYLRRLVAQEAQARPYDHR